MRENNSQQHDSRAQLLRGSAWMTFGSIASRILGAIYIIPWYAWMGSYGNLANSLTAKSYNIYSLFIIISTAGIPGAIAKQIAKYNAMNEYEVGRRLFHKGLGLMMAFGLVSAIIMFGAAYWLAGGNMQEVPVIRSLAYAVLIIPILSILRGYFQGYNDMKPSAISQFIEQLARVVWMLLTAYVIMQVQHGNYVKAVIQSNLAAAVGAIFGILLLVYYYRKQKKVVDPLVANSNDAINVSTTDLIKEIIQQAIPFIIIDSGITLYQLFDQYTFHPMIAHVVHNVSYTQIEEWYALFGLNANKLIMIIVSLSTAMAVTAIPLLSGAHARHDYKDIAKQVENTLELFLFVMIPASFGMAGIAVPIYTVFYRYDVLGSSVLYVASFTAIMLGLFTVLMAVMQGLSENGLAIRYLIISLVIKAILQYPMIYLFKVYGPLLSTTVALLVIILLALKHLEVKFHFNLRRTTRRFMGILFLSMIMFLIVVLIVKFGGVVLLPERRWTALALVIVAVAVGGFLYAIMTIKLGIAQRILGSRIERLARKLHIRI